MSKSKETRQHIIQKSAAIFNQKGFVGTSMSDIMTATGLTKGGLYGNFKSKDELATEAFDYAIRRIWSTISARTHVIEHPLDKLKTVVYFYKEHVLAPPIPGGCPVLNTAVEADDQLPFLREKVLGILDLWKNRIAMTLQRGKKEGLVREDVKEDEFAIRFIATLEGGILLSRIKQEQALFDAIARQLLDMINDLQPKPFKD